MVVDDGKWVGGGCGVNGKMANFALIPCFGENVCIGLLKLTLTYNILLICIGLH